MRVSSTNASSPTTTPCRAPSSRSSANDRSPSPSDADAAQERAQARLQLADVERLDEVVVGAGVETVDAIGDRVARRQDQDRHAVSAAAHAAADLEPVDAGKPDVEHDAVGCPRLDRGDRLEALLGEHDLVPVDHECAAHGLADGAVVLDYQDSHRRIVLFAHKGNV